MHGKVWVGWGGWCEVTRQTLGDMFRDVWECMGGWGDVGLVGDVGWMGYVGWWVVWGGWCEVS